jgi:hypothetical protein
VNWLRKLKTRIRALLAKRQLDAEMDEEMRSHIEMQTLENIEAGMSPRVARSAALRQFGHAEGIKEACREQRGVSWIEHLVYDLRFAGRMMWRNPGSTTAIGLTLGLVIGVCSTLFTAINYQLFQPLPIEAPEHLVRLWRANDRGDRGELMNAARYAEYQRQSRSFSGLTALDSQSMILTGRGEPKRLQAAQVPPNFFEVFGIKPVLGRGFNAEAGADSQAHHVVIGYATWQEVFDQQPDVLGETLILDQQACTVTGVMPEDLGRVELAQRGISKATADHRSHPQGQLLFWCEPINTREDNALQRIGQVLGNIMRIAHQFTFQTAVAIRNAQNIVIT